MGSFNNHGWVDGGNTATTGSTRTQADESTPSACVGNPQGSYSYTLYDKGQAQANSTSSPSTFDAFAQYTQTDYNPVVTGSTPGRIASGGKMTLDATQAVINDQSSIVASGDLVITAPVDTQLALDPTVTQKRLGDGFYEQKLIREQVAQLTGRRFLGDYTSDQQQYQALMDSGLTFAKTFNLRPGIALTANQLALLTTAFNGQKSMDVGGQNNTLLYATQDVSQSTTTTQSSSGFAGISLSDKTTTDSKLQTTSIGTKLISNEKVTIGVGNKTELQGTDIQSPQTSFVKTDPSKAGELIIGASIDTTQIAHTEKSETAGVWQEQKGQGSTTQTLNQTKISGNVSFDNALKISAQIPDTKGGQALRSQINALVDQSGGTGLEYLNQLVSNPNVRWDKVALANEKWSYDQAGLTPAGAALLSIAVAVATSGMGSGGRHPLQ